MRAQTVRSVQHDIEEGREHQKDDGMDTYDLASDARDQEINVILTDRSARSSPPSTRRSAGSTTAATGSARSAGSTSPRPARGLAVHPSLCLVSVGS
jgi:hypothetical protein